jgi:hypothetical protein
MKNNSTKERLFEVTGRLDKTFKPLNEEVIPEQQVTAAAQTTNVQQTDMSSPQTQYADSTYKMIAPVLKRIRTVDQFPAAFKSWFSSLGYKPQASPLTIAQVRLDIEQVMRELGYK